MSTIYNNKSTNAGYDEIFDDGQSSEETETNKASRVATGHFNGLYFKGDIGIPDSVINKGDVRIPDTVINSQTPPFRFDGLYFKGDLPDSF